MNKVTQKLLSENGPEYVAPGTPEVRQAREKEIRDFLDMIVKKYGGTGLNSVGRIYDEYRRNRGKLTQPGIVGAQIKDPSWTPRVPPINDGGRGEGFEPDTHFHGGR